MEVGDISFTLVHPRYLDLVWPRVGPCLERATDTSGGRFSLDSVRMDILNFQQLLWVLFRGDDDLLVSATTQFVFYPLRKNLCVMFMGTSDHGERLWLRHRDLVVGALEDFAREHGCDGIELTGRVGWDRVLSKFGFEKKFIVLEKDL